MCNTRPCGGVGRALVLAAAMALEGDAVARAGVARRTVLVHSRCTQPFGMYLGCTTLHT